MALGVRGDVKQEFGKPQRQRPIIGPTELESAIG
jgi:hypothetical protein